MGLTIRIGRLAADAIARLPAIDRKAIHRVIQVLAASPDSIRKHPRAVTVPDVPEGLVIYTFVVGDWKPGFSTV